MLTDKGRLSNSVHQVSIMIMKKLHVVELGTRYKLSHRCEIASNSVTIKTCDKHFFI